MSQTDTVSQSIEPPRSNNTASDESLSLAIGWLEDCLSSHVTCNEGQTDPLWYPTRLLDLGPLGSGKTSVHLVHSTEQSLSGRYCTLSHRWGKSLFLNLTQETVNMLCQGIPEEQLPKTFRDAVVVSRRLGVRYLWIDSLCIMQDKTSDWLHESDKMHLVYSNSYCNLSASVSTDSSQGLFRSRQPHVLQPTQVHLRVKLPNKDFEHVWCNLYNSSFWKDHVSLCVVNKRGWVSD
jgi:hypothetical protein